MQFEETGKLMRSVGGLYEVRLKAGETPLSGKTVAARAKGEFRHQKLTPLVGDDVRLAYDQTAFSRSPTGEVVPTALGGAVIEEILPRKNALIRPPLSNLDLLFITLAAAEPMPSTVTVDKLISIAEYNHIEPVLIIGKSDLAPEYAEFLKNIYCRAGFRVFSLSARSGEGVQALKEFVDDRIAGKLCAFSGASGVGKSTLLNALFPSLCLATGEVSRKIARGKHTTRRVELYPVEGKENTYIADTPGFSMLDFVRFDFFTKEDLPLTMREFVPYIGSCRYTKCTHTKEDGCAVLAALSRGEISPSRHQSFLAMYEDLKTKHDWSKK